MEKMKDMIHGGARKGSEDHRCSRLQCCVWLPKAVRCDEREEKCIFWHLESLLQSPTNAHVLTSSVSDLVKCTGQDSLPVPYKRDSGKGTDLSRVVVCAMSP